MPEQDRWKDQVSPIGVPNQDAESAMDEMRGLGNSCSELDGKRKRSTLDLKCGANIVRLEDDHSEPIAVIGLSARLPQDAATTEGFWKMLCDGRSTRTEIPKDRFNIDAFYHPDPDRLDTTNVKSGHFLAGDITAFDAPFFSIQPAEAASMDPQQRIMLETCYRALENAGLPIHSVAGTGTSVYVGTSARDYEALLLRDPEMPAKYLGTGIGTSLLSNRVSWFFDLRGPSVTLDTACSISLTAMHLACQSLRAHESSMALVGGCNMILAPDVSMVHLSNMGFFSPDGRCFTFDRRANGYAKGEGAGVVILKLLADAVRDGDTIRAVVRATGTNQDGRTPGLTQPSQAAQKQNILNTYRAGGLSLDSTKYFEAHGTGTQIGDPIEAGAIHDAFQRSSEHPLLVGALKPNIGYLESASGVASLIKVVLSLERAMIPPNINFEVSNEAIPLDQWAIKFPLEITPWPGTGLRRASINSFGYGGSNAHCVLDDAYNYLRLRSIPGKHDTTIGTPPFTSLNGSLDNLQARAATDGADIVDQASSSAGGELRCYVWSAADANGLQRLAGLFKSYLCHKKALFDKCSAIDPEDMAYTLSNKRSHLPWKSYLIARSLQDLQQKISKGLSRPERSSVSPTTSFVFTGQGAQWPRMGHDLIRYPRFADSFSKSELCLQDLNCKWSLFEEFRKEAPDSRIDNSEISQTLCTALQIALIDLLVLWNILPTAVVGHSSGEIAAAYCSGSLSHSSAIKVAYYRGFYSAQIAEQASTPKAMASIAMSEEATLPYLKDIQACTSHGRVEIACVNSPCNVTVSGDLSCINPLIATLAEKGIFARKLKVSVAYHSTYMEEMSAKYLSAIQDIVTGDDPWSNNLRGRPRIFSAVTGTELPAEEFSRAEYWNTNLISKVRFSDALLAMLADLSSQRSFSNSTKDLLIEVGPTAALQRPVKDIILHSNIPRVSYDSILYRDADSVETCLGFVGRLHCRGYSVNLLEVNTPNRKEAGLHLLTDLPAYPFNHEHSHWTESRVSTNFRMRKHGRHELLGAPSADWNPAEPRWRNVIKISESPWIVDHQLGGAQLYPAGGMMIMAIEAMRQLADPSRKINGYRLQNVVFGQALLVPEASDSVEVQFSMKRQLNPIDVEIERGEFTIYSVRDHRWSQICSGVVSLEYEVVHTRKDTHIASFEKSQKTAYLGSQRCKESVQPTQFYKNLSDLGFGFGSFFQPLENIRYNDVGEAAATIRVNGWREKDPKINVKEHVIHPTAIDGLFQPIETEIQVYTKSTFRGYREADFSIVAVDEQHQAQIVVEGWRETSLSNMSVLTTTPGLRCYHIDWQPDPYLMTSDDILQFCGSSAPQTVLFLESKSRQLALISAFFIQSALEKLPFSTDGRAVYLHSYAAWMQQARKSEIKCLLDADPQGQRLLCGGPLLEQTLDNMRISNPDCDLYIRVGRHLAQIMDAQMNPTDIISPEIMQRGCDLAPNTEICHVKIADYVRLLANKNPALKILELGTSTSSGSIAEKILHALDSSDSMVISQEYITKWQKYTCTNLSPELLHTTEERLEKWSNHLSHAAFDPMKDIVQQGFEYQEYDLLISSLALSTNRETCLQNLRKLLKPSGKLVLVEQTNPENIMLPFISGLCPDWWPTQANGHSNRRDPILSHEDWNDTLAANGFSGVDVRLPDFEDPVLHAYSAMISSPAPDPDVSASKPRTTVIVVDKGSQKQCELASQIRQNLGINEKQDTKIKFIEEIRPNDLNQTSCIFLVELERPFMYDMSLHEFNVLKGMILTAKSVLWVTQGCGEKPENPACGLVTGFGRNVQSESWNVEFVELAIDEPYLSEGTTAEILKVHEMFRQSSRLDTIEPEYMQKDGKLHISRVIPSPYLNRSMSAKLSRKIPETQKFGVDQNRALKLTLDTVGLLDSLHFVDDDRIQEPLAPEDVEIKVEAVGLNFKDVMIALGQIPGNALGFECAGVVSRIGEQVNLKLYERVLCCTNTGAYGTYARTHRSSVAKIPNALSFSAAAALPTNLCTAYYSLVILGRVQEGENVLITSGAGGVGQAAIQLAKILRASIFVTVGTDEKRRFLIDTYGLAPDHILSSRHASFVQDLKANTEGFDVVLNSLSGDALKAAWSRLRPFGRFVELGKKDINSHEKLPMDPFSKSVTFSSVDLGLLMGEAKLTMGTTLQAVMDLLAQYPTILKGPQPVKVFNVSDIEGAFRSMQSGNNIGKVVVHFDQESEVPVMPSSLPTYNFEPDATYVIAGGLGGLGRSITRWMVDRKARNFLLLSRSGAKSKEALELVEEMTSRGIRILAPPCNVNCESALSAVIKRCREIVPPIKGCIQASMVLKDGLFANLSHNDFQAAITPKVSGSWNLHTLLPRDLDFFILLSSVASVTGTRAQSNYAAGNSYQDALARHRVSKGEKTISLNLGAILSIGIAAEKDLTESLDRDGFVGLSKEDLFALLDYFCNPSLPVQPPGKVQVVTGLGALEQGRDVYWTQKPLFSILRQQNRSKTNSSSSKNIVAEGLPSQLASASQSSEAVTLILCALKEKLAKTLHISEEDVDEETAIHSFGVDSLVALEIRYWFEKEVEVQVSVLEIMGSAKLGDLVEVAFGRRSRGED